MAAPSTTVELLEQVLALGLCDATKLPADQSLLISPTDLVKRLVRKGVWTRFQGRMILAGKGRRLILGKYRLLRPLGKGGGGSVYLGEHTDLRRHVAVKVQRNAGDDPLVTERFRREARSAAALDHPNIVKLYDFGLAHGAHYLVMEYVPGVTLQKLMDDRGRLVVPSAVHLVTQVAVGLAHAHARGFVHRDIKPLNLMVTPDGGVKVLDMGLARALDRGEDRLTEQAADATICGTIDYLSPEQAVGVVVDGRSDIYNLGVLLFALLAGRLPFLGSPAEKVAQHQTATPPALDQVVPTVPPPLARVVEKMLAKRSGERPQTCQAVIDALAPWCPPTPPDFGLIDPHKTVNIRAGRPATTDWSEDESRRTTARRWRVVRWASGALVAVAFALGLVFALTPPPATTDTASDPPAEVWEGEGTLTGHLNNVNELVFTPDGTRLIGVDWSGGVCVWDTATARLLTRDTLKVDAAGNCVCLSPTGRAVVCGTHMPTVVWNLGTRAVEQTFEERTERTWAAIPSPDGRRMLLATDSTVAIHDAATGERERALDLRLAYIWGAAYSADGKLVAACGRDPGPTERETGSGAIAIWEADTGRLVHRLGGHIRDVRWVAFNADATRLTSGGFDNEIRVWDLASGQCERTFTDTNLYVERVHFLPGGGLLAVSACDPRQADAHTSRVSVWDPDAPQTTPVWRNTFAGRATTVAYSPACRMYAVANKDQKVWLLKAPPEMK